MSRKRRKARYVSTALLVAAVLAIAVWSLLGWSPTILFLLLFGPNYPPTANDDTELGFCRTVLGFLALLFVFIGFTPTPFII